MIDARERGLMKREAYLINTARGALEDESALAVALRERRIAGAAPDTFVMEPLHADSPLRDLDNVILTPHLEGITLEAYGAAVRAALGNIRAILSGETPPYCRNPQVLPRGRGRLARIAG